MYDLTVFTETLGCMLAATVLAFWLGRVTRDKEVEALKFNSDFHKDRAEFWEGRVQKRDASGRFTKKR